MPDDLDAHWHDEPDWQDCRDTHPHAVPISWPAYVALLIGGVAWVPVIILAALAYNEWRG